MSFYIDVIVPLPIDIIFTYRINKSEYGFLKKGSRVIVPFGNSKLITGIVCKIHNETPTLYNPKEIEYVIDEVPIVNERQLEFFKWMSNYYMCSIGQVIKNAIPSLLLLKSESQMVLNYDSSLENLNLSKESDVVIDLLVKNKKISFQELTDLVGKKNVNKTINELTEKSIIKLNNEIYDYFKSKKLTRIFFPKSLSNSDLNKINDKLINKKSQFKLFNKIKNLNKENYSYQELEKIASVSRSTIDNLIKANVLQKHNVEVDRRQFEVPESLEKVYLTKDQKEALIQIKNGFKQKNVCLLHGVTSSGKTEIYIKLIEDYIEEKKQILFLVPEIALTTQLVGRVKKYFGDLLSVYHSKYSVDHRTEIWKKVLNNDKKSRVILGARSSIFLPFSNLGLIIIDEEHENAYKQYNTAPRYHARDSAIYLSSIHNVNTLLGSATPSIESYYNAISSKYALIEIKKRFGNFKFPEIIIQDLRTKKVGNKESNNFSNELINHIKICEEKKTQVILFQNRRGYSPYLECESCGVVYKCSNCDVSLTFHKYSNELKCHYCGFRDKNISKCKNCSNSNLLKKGIGTQLVEQEIKLIFPKLKVRRMDHDTTKSKNSFRKIIEDFEENNFDVLVGTQMVTKGLDFKNVTLVGVVNADALIFFPSFRSQEKCYQILQQVSGRSGRSHMDSKVVIQTYNPNHQIFKRILKNDYKGMFNEQLNQRLLFNYPPYSRLIKITMKHRDLNNLDQAIVWFSSLLRKRIRNDILGPEFPLIPRIKNKFIKQLLIKMSVNNSFKNPKSAILKSIKSMGTVSKFKSIEIIIDVDPYD